MAFLVRCQYVEDVEKVCSQKMCDKMRRDAPKIFRVHFDIIPMKGPRLEVIARVAGLGIGQTFLFDDDMVRVGL